ncbi:hypothetical protein CBR_g30251 [Chara braunii]|uniref:Peptidoglycan binding-like domain-containing protein n=1 Tax=Chara braunii TaxID=69332 RepID=A0A388LCF5_CHABU|nr:hypothetical protein CBR_g30251 [Chara braunii]|eukprot:GBG79990.1 hypothetical protein CBR_g30251 [Chara braunii]
MQISSPSHLALNNASSIIANQSSYGIAQNLQNLSWSQKWCPRQLLHEYYCSSSPLRYPAHDETLLPPLKPLSQLSPLHGPVLRVCKTRRMCFALSRATSSLTATSMGSRASDNLCSKSYRTSCRTVDASIERLRYGGGGGAGAGGRVSVPMEWILVVRKSGRLGVHQIRARNSNNSESEEDPWEREERRWLREEQRWLREEERWLREHARWELERQRSEEERERLKNELESLRHELELATAALSQQPEVVGAASRISDLVDIIEKFRALAGGTQAGLETLGTTEKKRANNILGDGAGRMTLPDGVLQREDDSVGFTESRSLANTGSDHEALSFVSEPSPRAGAGTEPGPGTAAGTGAAASKAEASSTTAVGSGALTVNGHGRAVGGAVPAKRRTLRFGSEGDDVKVLQDALATEGFYSGEEEMEFCMFDRGTERALKTYQSSIGVKEDGVVTAEIWSRLLGVEVGESQGTAKPSEDTVTENVSRSSLSAAPVSRTEVDRSAAQTELVGKVEQVVEERRVYLLGEGRWEQPSRIRKNTEPNTSSSSSRFSSSSSSSTNSTEGKKELQKCYACRGEGLMLCSECQGTGELNVEDQFLEWAGEDPKCPYCEGTGFLACDVCDGSGHEPNPSIV